MPAKLPETPLADRIVPAGTTALQGLSREAALVAAAVLRELALIDRTVKGGDVFLADDFDQLANEIEGRFKS